jgi:hypothetical protein
VRNIIEPSVQVLKILSPGEYDNSILIQDILNVFTPALITAVQTIPIPRLEVSTPEIDLLLENILLTPGRSFNNSSFLPYRFNVSAINDFTVCKTRANSIKSITKTKITLTVSGLSVATKDVSFWLRTHAGFLRFTDSGLLSIALDQRGVDVSLEFSVHHTSAEHIVTLNSVRVHAHTLKISLRSSKFSLMAYVLRPFLRPLLRATLQRHLASSIAAGFHALNRELVFARERLRATRVAEPQDLVKFFKALASRWEPDEDPEVYTRVGVDEPGKGVFEGIYTPFSVVKMWHEEAMTMCEMVEDGAEERGWRNAVFTMD